MKELLTDPLGAAGILLLAVWLALKIVVVRNDIVSRHSAIRSCDRQLQKASLVLEMALATPQPMRQLGDLQQNLINPLVDRATSDDVWPFSNPILPHDLLQDEIEAEVGRLVRQYGGGWEAPPQDDSQQQQV